MNNKAPTNLNANKVRRCNTCNVVLPGPYGTPGVAMSRTLSGILLCSGCGTAEAMKDAGLIVEKQKVSAWLGEHGSHEIYSATELANDFEKCTGQKFPAFVRTYTWKETRDTMKARGLGGTLKEEKTQRVIWGYVMASDFAKGLVNYVCPKMGRMNIFYDSIKAIEDAGL